MAKRSQFYAVATDTEGNSLADVTVTVYNVGTEVEATIYAQRSGGSTTPSSFETGADGEITFWAEPGAYDIHLEDSILPNRIGEKTITWDSVSGDAQGIDGNQLEALGIDIFRMGDNSVDARVIAAPSTQTGTLGSDQIITELDTYTTGASVTVNQGTGLYLVSAYQTISTTGTGLSATNLTFKSRLVNVFSPFDTKRDTSRWNGSGTTAEYRGFTHVRYVSMTDGTAISLQGTGLGSGLGISTQIEADGAYVTATRVA